MIGTKLAHYEITSHLGTGGMGEVYQATDAKLGRSVAIKLVRDAGSPDSERVGRFAREARVLASLNHPNIAAIYGVEEFAGRAFLVMELVPGKTLADQVRLGALPLDEALRIAEQIINGLEAAHEKGIMHRDLKPANIKITPHGQVKLLDFGLAKAFSGDAADVNLSNSPTLNTAATNAGTIIGTAAYMSPEQAKGKETDRGSDIWAFGCVLYEMLSGRGVFEGESLGEILGSVFKSEPDWAALPPSTPPAIVSLLKRCLQKDRSRRLRDIADARFALEEAAAAPASPQRKGTRKERVVWAGVTLALALALAVTATRNTTTDARVMRLEISTPPGASPSQFPLSPDGTRLVYQATVDGKQQLWLRSLDSETAQPLAGTEGAINPFWSPDNRSIGFFAGGQLKRLDVAGGLVQALADAPLNTRGGAWSADGTIVFTHSSIEPLFQIPAQGGTATPATELVPPHKGHRYPYFFPDGRHFLYFAYGPTESQGIYVGLLNSKDSHRLLDSDSAAVFVPPDYVLFSRQGGVLAQRVDLSTYKTIGEPLPVARRTAMPAGTVAEVALSASMTTGTVAYRPDLGQRQMRWVDRSGKPAGVLGGIESNEIGDIRISPDGRTVSFSRMAAGNNDIWLMETSRDVQQRFTTDPGRDMDPVWSTDGSRIVFGSTRNGVLDLFEKAANGAPGTEKLLWESIESKNVFDWSSDGDWLLFASQNPKNARDLWVLPMKGEKRPIAVAQTGAEERGARFSPDAKWIAYESNESGRFEIYLQPFQTPGNRIQVSTGGGTTPQWGRGGTELFYKATDHRVMAVPIDLSRPQIEPGKPVSLFSLSPGAVFAAQPDGPRFLLLEIIKDPSPITILLNWKPR